MLTTPSNGQFGPEAPKEVAPATVFPSDVTLHRVQAGSTPFSVTSSMLLLQTQVVEKLVFYDQDRIATTISYIKYKDPLQQLQILTVPNKITP
ncbi:unnamed protein product [Timema podura]|uniref:Uncharacterized protein n=1 Tax=Timema podura TaxID=61482 RepID=A0ABN7NY65_TIMPD|nr:unnamed protein product [Timema podura]